MRKGSLALGVVVCAVVALAACDRETESAGETGTSALFAPGGNGGGSCDFRALKGDARDYFSNPESRDAQDLIKLMEDACDDGNAAGLTAAGWQLLSFLEHTLYRGRGGPAAAGDGLVNGALAFMFPCDAADLSCEVPTGDFTNSLAPDAPANGAFGVRGMTAADTTPVFSRGTPTWSMEPGRTAGGSAETWQASLPADEPVALVFGFPKSSTTFPVNDTRLGSTYEWNLIPPLENGFRKQLVVGVCGDEIDPEDATTEVPRVQRNSTALQVGETSACFRSDYEGEYPFAMGGSSLGPLASLALDLVGAVTPRPLWATLVGVGGGGVGGQVNNFSDFTPVGATTDAELVFVSGPGDATIGGDGTAALGEVQVLARTVLGTPLEFVAVTIEAKDNNGATVVLGGSLTQLTVENGGVATFDDLDLNKTGGYQLCATAVAEGFLFVGTFCSLRFNVRPN